MVIFIFYVWMQAMLFQIFSEKKCDYLVMHSSALFYEEDATVIFFMSQQNIKTPLI